LSTDLKLIWEQAMRAALAEARKAAVSGDVPVGSVLLNQNKEVVAAGHNSREVGSDATAHAEMIVLRKASHQAGNWRLTGYTLIVTLEPCAMCAMAAVWARIDRIVYGTSDAKAGAVWSLYNIPQDQRLNHQIKVTHGVLKNECRNIMSEFFQGKRDF